MRTRSSLSVAALLLAMPVAARGEDAAPADPVGRAAKVLASMPAPSEKAGVKVDLELWAMGMNIGSGSLVAAPGTADEKPVWNVEEKLVVAVGPPKKLVSESKAVLGQDLHLISAEGREGSEGEDGTTTTAKRTGKGFDWTKKGADVERAEAVEADGATVGALCSVVLFLMHCPPEPATYELHALNREKGAVESGTIEAKGAAKFVEADTTLDAWMASGTIGAEEIEVYFTPGAAGERQFIAFRMVKERVTMAKAGVVKLASVPDFGKPAASATECGSRLAQGILTSDEALISGVIHWATMHADAKKEGFPLDEVAYKDQVMAGFRATFKKMKPEEAWQRVKKAAAGAKETLADEVTSVAFGAPMEGFKYAAKSIDGGWFITKFSK